MGFSIKQNTKVAVSKEVTEGTYVAPTDAEFITLLEDGTEINGSKEVIERNILGLGLTKAQSRTANRSVAGSLGIEFKAGSAEGDTPEYGALVEAAMGATDQRAATTTTATGHTTTVINIEDADISNFKIGDIVQVKQSGDNHLSPITAVDTTVSAANITLLVGGAVAFSDNVEISKATNYQTADGGHPTFSVTKYIEDNIKTTGRGCRVTAMTLDNFSANQVANWTFNFEGLDFETTVDALTNTPSYDSSLPPIIVQACIYKDGIVLPVSDFSMSIENTIGTITSTCAKSGKISSRITERVVSGTMTPYIQDDDVVIQDEFDQDSLYSVFGYAYNPTAVDGEYNQVIAFYLPNCNTTELSEGDLDGVLQHSISFSASGGASGTQTQAHISFI